MILQSQFGRWIMEPGTFMPGVSRPRKRLQGLVIFYPPATGDDGQQFAEALQLLDIGIASLLVNPPYRQKSYLQAKRVSKTEVQMRIEALLQAEAVFDSAEFAELIESFQQSGAQWVDEKMITKNQGRLPIALVGKNLGGSIAAFICSELKASLRKRKPSALIITGAVPELSEFWKCSDHPVAQRFRQTTACEDQRELVKILSPFDLMKLCPKLTLATLIQFGHKDLWIDKASADKLSPSGNVKICWTDDDHDMNLAQSVSARRSFLEQTFKLGG